MKNPNFGDLRSSTLTPIKSLSPVHVMISSMSVPICNHFLATQDNWGKITTFQRGSHLSRPPALDSLNLGGRDLSCYNLRLVLKISYAGCFGLSPAISSQFTVEMCDAAKNCEKFTKQGRSRSSMLINLKSLSPVLVMISNKCVPICSRFHTRRANRVKIALLEGVPLFDTLVRWEPLYPGA